MLFRSGLGIELVAPREEIANVLRAFGNGAIDETCRTLAVRFGLPGQVFHHMVRSPDTRRVISFLEDIRPAFRLVGKRTL